MAIVQFKERGLNFVNTTARITSMRRIIGDEHHSTRLRVYGYVDIVRVLLAKGSMAEDTTAASGHNPLSYVEAYRHRSYNDCRDELLTFIWEYRKGQS